MRIGAQRIGDPETISLWIEFTNDCDFHADISGNYDLKLALLSDNIKVFCFCIECSRDFGPDYFSQVISDCFNDFIRGMFPGDPYKNIQNVHIEYINEELDKFEIDLPPQDVEHFQGLASEFLDQLFPPEGGGGE